MSDPRERDRNAGSPVGGIRLNKYLASCGIASRREADRLIEEGEVRVGGKVASPGDKVLPGETVTVSGKLVNAPQRRIAVAYYKPAGVTCTERDPHAERTLKEAFSYPVRLTYAGRLDRDSEGLLIMTNDGDLIDAMMRGANGHEQEYVVRTVRRIADADLQRMEKGIWLKDLDVKTRPCKIRRLGDYTFSVVLTQGLNRQLRRMCKAVGHEVKFLKRIRVLTVSLGGMHPGEQRTLSNAELNELYEAAGLPAPYPG